MDTNEYERRAWQIAVRFQWTSLSLDEWLAQATAPPQPTQRTWTVSYTAKRKLVWYQRQTVTVEVTEEQYRRLFRLDDARIDSGVDPDREPDDAEIEQLAVEHSDPDDAGWITTGNMEEALDEQDFEITNGKR